MSISDAEIRDALLPDNDSARWNAGQPLGQPTVVNYSFPDRAPGYLGEFDSDLASDFAPLDEGARDLVRDALDAWSDVTGLRFVEYDADNGQRAPELSFALDVDLSETEGFSGFAYYPGVSSYGVSDIGGDAFFDPKVFEPSYGADSASQIILHEIGHAIGLKHPFDGNATLPGDLDNTSNTVMSYTRVGPAKTTPQAYDRIATQHLYGDAGERTLGGEVVGRTPNGTLVVEGTARGDDLAGYNGAEQFFGGAGDDAISGGGGGDLLQGNQGRDTLTDSGGDDTLRGGADPDVIDARGAGDKLILGDKGNDQITAEGTRLHIEGGNFRSTGDPLRDRDAITADSDGDDYIQANFGRDTVVLRGGGNDGVRGGKDADRIDVAEADGLNHVYGDGGDDLLILGAGEDVVHYGGGDGSDEIRGFDPDQDSFSPERGAVVADVTDGADGAEVTMDDGARLTFVGVGADAFDDTVLV